MINRKRLGTVVATLLVVLAATAFAEKKGFSEADLYRILYPEFLKIESFGNIRVVFKGEGAKKIGLNEKELTDFLKFKFKNSFAEIPYRDQSDKIHDIYEDKNKAKTIGSIVVRVWIVGDSYPIVYHMEIIAGTFEKMTAYTNAVLGYDLKRNVPDKVRITIGEFVKELAIKLFKARGEL